MFKLKIYCNDGDIQYWEDGNGTYETYDKALIACYGNALQETQSLIMGSSNGCPWFEVNADFEITDTYVNECLELGTIIPVATVCYDHAPWDRENDCDIEIVTGYLIVEC